MTCAIGPKNNEGELTTCSAMAISTVPIAAGCVSYVVTNDQNGYDALDNILTAGMEVAKKFVEPQSQTMYDNLVKHHEIWECFGKNAVGQVGDPDQVCAYAWAKKYYVGWTDVANMGKYGRPCTSTSYTHEVNF